MWPIGVVNGREIFQSFWSEAPWKPASHAPIRHTLLWFSHHFIQLPVLFRWFCSSVIKQHILKFFRYCNGSKNSSSRQSCTRWDARSGGRNKVWRMGAWLAGFHGASLQKLWTSTGTLCSQFFFQYQKSALGYFVTLHFVTKLFRHHIISSQPFHSKILPAQDCSFASPFVTRLFHPTLFHH